MKKLIVHIYLVYIAKQNTTILQATNVKNVRMEAFVMQKDEQISNSFLEDTVTNRFQSWFDAVVLGTDPRYSKKQFQKSKTPARKPF